MAVLDELLAAGRAGAGTRRIAWLLFWGERAAGYADAQAMGLRHDDIVTAVHRGIWLRDYVTARRQSSHQEVLEAHAATGDAFAYEVEDLLFGALDRLAKEIGGLEMPEPPETYHTSAHLYTDLAISTDISGKHVLIVEEIIDAGRKLMFLKNHLLANNPLSVKVVTLIDKPARRELPIKAEYIGRTIDDRYVVGYGMDMAHQFRELPFVGHVVSAV